MAVNFHKDLPNSQIHNPKDFSTANINSVCTKDENSLLKWAKANYTTSTTIKCTADVSKQLAGTYFYLYTSNDAVKYQVWFDVDSDPGTVSADSGCTLAEVDIVENDPANTVATRLGNVLNALSGVTATVSTDTVTVTGITSATDITDVTTNFTFTPTRTQVANEYLATDNSGNIVWIPQRISDRFKYFGFTITHAPRNNFSHFYRPRRPGHVFNSTSTSIGTVMPVPAFSNALINESAVYFFPAGTTPVGMEYSVFHNDTSAMQVDFHFFIVKYPSTDTGTSALTPLGSISQSIAAGTNLLGDISFTHPSVHQDNKSAVLVFAKIPAQKEATIHGSFKYQVS